MSHKRWIHAVKGKYVPRKMNFYGANDIMYEKLWLDRPIIIHGTTGAEKLVSTETNMKFDKICRPMGN